VPTTATLSRATVIKVAQLVGAGEVIVGSYRLKGSELTVQVQGIRLEAGRLQPHISERGQLTDLFDLYARIARRLSRNAPVTGAPLAQAPLGAFENYIKGLVADSPAVQATFLESAIQEHPVFDPAYLALWEVRTEQGDHAAALAAARGVQARSPLARRSRFLAAVSLLNLERYGESFDAFRQLLDESSGPVPDAAAIHNNLGVVQIRRGGTPQTGTAAYYLTKAVDQDPADPDYLFNVGYAYVLDRDYQGALYWLREALRRDPADADAHFVLAAALQATGSTVEASREKDLARQLSSRYEELERRATAEKLPVPRGLERVQDEPDGSRAIRAEQVIASSAQREQKELATFHLEHGRRLFEREQDREAMDELRRAVYLSPYEAQAHLLIGRIHLRAGRPAEAIDALKISIWSEDSATARVALAEAYLKSGDSKAARAEAERALGLDPGSAEAKRLLAEIK
jgi:Tfp pilus assembly protein PilF